MIAHVAGLAPLEACGFLAGVNGESTAVLPVSNVLASPLQYRMDPGEQLQAMISIEENGWEILGIFHSHPTGPAVPSTTDIKEAFYPDSVYLILAPEGERWVCQAYSIDEMGVSAVKIELVAQ